ncbi:MAG: hypothetical protein ACTHJ8_02140 [Mucilaginibacter sp.]|jgi:hypothetical protein
MKKIIALMLACTFAAASFAQTVAKKETKVRRTSSLSEKVHNTFHKHKHYNGYKVKSVKKVDKKVS